MPSSALSLVHLVVGAPIHACKAYAIYPYVQSLKAMYDRAVLDGIFLDVVLADNTDDDGRFAADVRRAASGIPGARVIRAELNRSSPLPIHDRICASQNALRALVLFYPACVGWLSIECDVIAPPQTPKRMIDELARRDLHALQARFRDDYDAARFERERFWLMGLSLIGRAALYALPFRYERQRPNGYSDAFLGHDLTANGMPFGFTDEVVAKHMNSPADGAARGWSTLSADQRRTKEYSEWLLGERRGEP